MLKLSTIALLLALSFEVNHVASVPFEIQVSNHGFTISSVWAGHAKDFAALVDKDKVMAVVMKHLNDLEVLNFVTFIYNDEFKQIILEFESMAEFKEAMKFLGDKGYDVESAIDFINSALNLPPLKKSALVEERKNDVILRGTGMTGLIEDVLATLPIKEIKELFESKLETSPEIAKLFETIKSPEFTQIMKKMSKNHKFIEIKNTFAGYGFDFKYLCATAKGILGKYYQGVFCEN